MTSEEIKQNLTMREVVEQNGIRIDRKGFCCCPFHNEKTASMKIYKDSFHCFGCGANGDIFTFTQQLNNCDFKTAFLLLGGTYKHMTNNAKIRANTRRERALKEKERQLKAEQKFKQELSYCIDLMREGIKVLEPFTDDWTFCQNKLVFLLHVWEEKIENGKEIETLNVYRELGAIRRKFNS